MSGWRDYPITAQRIIETFDLDPRAPLPYHADDGQGDPPVDEWKLTECERQYADCTGCRGLYDCTSIDEGLVPLPFPRHVGARKLPNDYHTPDLVVLSWHSRACRYARDTAAVAADERSAERAGVEKRYRSVTLADFERVRGTEEAVKVCEEYVAARSWTEGVGVILIGGVGTGKTHLANAIINQARRKGHRALFVTAPDVLGQGAKHDGDKWGEDIFAAACVADVLALDDIGTEYIKEPGGWAAERLNTLLDTRYRAHRGTVMTSNLNMIDLKGRFGERATDRIQEMCRAALLRCDSYRRQR